MGYKGSRTGVGGQICSLIGLVLMVYASIAYYNIISEVLFGFLPQKWAKPFSFILIALIIFIFIKVVERVLNLVAAEDLAIIERLGGVFVATARAIMMSGVIGMFILLLPVESLNLAAREGSKTCMFFVNVDAGVYSVIEDRLTPSDSGNEGERFKKIKAGTVKEFLDLSEQKK